jgi:hypothetical protein
VNWITFAWVAATLVPLLLLGRWIHRHLQGVALLLVKDPDVAILLYALPLLPGVALHELSHALAGRLMGVHVERIHIQPARKEGRIQLGFVPMEETGPLKTAIIGLAPLLVGCTAMLLIGYRGLQLRPLGEAVASLDWPAMKEGLRYALQAPNAWVWAYLAFAVSNTMLPSRSDMRAWPVIALFLALATGLAIVLGSGSSLADSLVVTLRWLAVACSLILIVDLPFALLILGIEKGLERVRGVRVEYR